MESCSSQLPRACSLRPHGTYPHLLHDTYIPQIPMCYCFLCAHAYACLCACVSVCASSCMCRCVCACSFMCRHVYAFIPMYVHVEVRRQYPMSSSSIPCTSFERVSLLLAWSSPISLYWLVKEPQRLSCVHISSTETTREPPRPAFNMALRFLRL